VSGSSAVLLAAGLLAATVLMWRLPQLVAGATPHSGDVTLVIPARDESGNLPVLLASIASQTQRPRQVLVVDDDSHDDTAAIARTHGADVVASGGPPEGWLGKPWACHLGTEVATGRHLVFLDADVRLAPDALGRLLATQAGIAPDGLLSVQPFHEVERPYESLSAISNLVTVLASGMGVPGQRVSDVAFGPCLVTTRDALAAVGGWAAVRGEIVEDVALAGAYRAVGRPVRCVAGAGAVRFRMYPDGLGSLIEGWTKNLAAGAARSALLPTIGAVLWVCAAMSVIWQALTVPGPLVGLAWVLMASHLWLMLRRLGSFPWITAAVFPVPVLAFTALFARSLALRALRRPVRWRGRRIDLRRGTTI
jgi:4,4'-diaponeurosporenoate glycosyltransferase